MGVPDPFRLARVPAPAGLFSRQEACPDVARRVRARVCARVRAYTPRIAVFALHSVKCAPATLKRLKSRFNALQDCARIRGGSATMVHCAVRLATIRCKPFLTVPTVRCSLGQ